MCSSVSFICKREEVKSWFLLHVSNVWIWWKAEESMERVITMEMERRPTMKGIAFCQPSMQRLLVSSSILT